MVPISIESRLGGWFQANNRPILSYGYWVCLGAIWFWDRDHSYLHFQHFYLFSSMFSSSFNFSPSIHLNSSNLFMLIYYKWMFVTCWDERRTGLNCLFSILPLEGVDPFVGDHEKKVGKIAEHLNNENDVDNM